jgi:glutaredoxin 3
MDSARIVFYARPGCPHCDAARAALVTHGEPFEERDPLSSPELLREFLACAATAAVPAVVVNGQVVVGFDAARLDEVLREPIVAPDPPDDYRPEELPDLDGDVTGIR